MMFKARTHNSGICNSRADGRPIGKKSLFSCSYQLDGILSAANVTFSNKTKVSDSTSVTERYCPAVANTFSLCAISTRGWKWFNNQSIIQRQFFYQRSDLCGRCFHQAHYAGGFVHSKCSRYKNMDACHKRFVHQKIKCVFKLRKAFFT